MPPLYVKNLAPDLKKNYALSSRITGFGVPPEAMISSLFCNSEKTDVPVQKRNPLLQKMPNTRLKIPHFTQRTRLSEDEARFCRDLQVVLDFLIEKKVPGFKISMKRL